MKKLVDSEKKYSSTSGMNTRVWGPRLWDSLFIMILGSYPVKIDYKNKEHLKIKKSFKNTLTGLQYTLPCSYCRKSFVDFLKIIDIDCYLSGRIKLAFWLYSMKDLVNTKLLRQSDIAKKEGRWCPETIKSPKFKEVLDKYEVNRAKCDKKLKRCINLTKKQVGKNDA